MRSRATGSRSIGMFVKHVLVGLRIQDSARISSHIKKKNKLPPLVNMMQTIRLASESNSQKNRSVRGRA